MRIRVCGSLVDCGEWIRTLIRSHVVGTILGSPNILFWLANFPFILSLGDSIPVWPTENRFNNSFAHRMDTSRDIVFAPLTDTTGIGIDR